MPAVDVAKVLQVVERWDALRSRSLQRDALSCWAEWARTQAGRKRKVRARLRQLAAGGLRGALLGWQEFVRARLRGRRLVARLVATRHATRSADVLWRWRDYVEDG